MTVLRIFFVIIIFPLSALSQTVVTSKRSSHIEGQNVDGYQVEIDAPQEELKASLARFMKTIGKTRTSGDYITITNPVINGNAYAGTLFGTTRGSGPDATAWMGLRLDKENDEGASSSAVDKLVYNFGIAFHREVIQAKIDESMRAYQAVEKQQMRLVNQNKDLTNKLESNKRQKIALEKALVENQLEFEELTRKLEANAKAQDSVAVAGEQIKKVVEMHKERQRKVN